MGLSGPWFEPLRRWRYWDKATLPTTAPNVSIGKRCPISVSRRLAVALDQAPVRLAAKCGLPYSCHEQWMRRR
jgi:hypothetical protein